MGLEKRSIKIIVIVIVGIFIIGGSVGWLLGFLLYQQPYVELEVWPQPEVTDLPLINFKVNDLGSWNPWVRRINEFLSVYETSVPEEPPHAPCSIRPLHEETRRSERCNHAMRYWEPCTVDTLYGYITGTPCIFLRLTHVDQWVPQPYNISVSFPPNMPEHLKLGLNHPSARYEDYIWVSCKGESKADEENIGEVQYIPGSLPPGFPLRRLQTAYKIPEAGENLTHIDRGPLLAVFFPHLKRGVVVNVECRIWTRDIVYNNASNIGRTRFEILIY